MFHITVQTWLELRQQNEEIFLLPYSSEMRSMTTSNDKISFNQVILRHRISFTEKDHLFCIRGKNSGNINRLFALTFFSSRYSDTFNAHTQRLGCFLVVPNITSTSAKILRDWSHLTACLLNLDITPKCGTLTFPAGLFVQRSQKPNTCNFSCKAKT